MFPTKIVPEFYFVDNKGYPQKQGCPFSDSVSAFVYGFIKKELRYLWISKLDYMNSLFLLEVEVSVVYNVCILVDVVQES